MGVPETEVPEADGAEGWYRDGRCASSTFLYSFSGCDCLISFEWCVWTSDV